MPTPPPAPILAVHEAAHAVVAETTGYGEVVAVVIDGEFGLHGKASLRSMNRKGFPSLASSERGRDYLLAAAVTSAAGPVAQSELGVPCPAWAEEEEAVRDGYGAIHEHSDYRGVSDVATLLEVPIAEVWERTREIVAQPEVWAAINAVADALVALREAGRPARLDATAYRDLAGERIKELAFTSMNDAMEAARYGS